jgi:four helix bundle protein
MGPPEWLDTWSLPRERLLFLCPIDGHPRRAFRTCWCGAKPHELVLAIYTLTATFPKPETYGLSLQIRRSAVSVPANIAEGFRRRSRTEKARFLNMAESSLEETRYFLILARDLKYGDTAPLTPILFT